MEAEDRTAASDFLSLMSRSVRKVAVIKQIGARFAQVAMDTFSQRALGRTAEGGHWCFPTKHHRGCWSHGQHSDAYKGAWAHLCMQMNQ